MKNSTQTTIALKSIDLTLKSLLENDLKNYRANKSKNTEGKQLIAA
ncbi:MAG: hypothetical protein ACXVI9_12140 [Mucilaginibacter sp.]